MKLRKNLLCTILILSALPCFSRDKNSIKNWSVQLAPHTGYKYLFFEEYFFSQQQPDKQVSQLEWDVNPLWTLGLDSTFQYKNLGITLGITSALPLRNGIMRDSDFDIFNGMKIIYSKSQIETLADISADAVVNYSFTPFRYLSLIPFADFEFDYMSMKAENGYGWYGSETKSHGEVAWNDPLAKFYPAGKLNGLELTKNSLQIFTGITLKTEIKRVSAEYSIAVSPFAYFYTMDVHQGGALPDTHFEQHQRDYFKRLKMKLAFTYTITERIRPYISALFSTGTLFRGKLFTENPDSPLRSTGLSPQQTGSTQTSFNLDSGIKFIL